jgi:hypothetical protein
LFRELSKDTFLDYSKIMQYNLCKQKYKVSVASIQKPIPTQYITTVSVRTPRIVLDLWQILTVLTIVFTIANTIMWITIVGPKNIRDELI